MYYANKIHMHDQVFNQVDSIMDFYKKKPSKAVLFFEFSSVSAVLIGIYQLLEVCIQ